ASRWACTPRWRRADSKSFCSTEGDSMSALHQLSLLDTAPAMDAPASSDEAYTPPWLVEAARLVLGGIDLDPASCLAAQQVVQAPTWYSAAQDGLAQPWRGRMWLNPPFSDSLPWAQKAI